MYLLLQLDTLMNNHLNFRHSIQLPDGILKSPHLHLLFPRHRGVIQGSEAGNCSEISVDVSKLSKVQPTKTDRHVCVRSAQSKHPRKKFPK